MGSFTPVLECTQVTPTTRVLRRSARRSFPVASSTETVSERAYNGTRRQLGTLFDVEDLGTQPLAGFAEPQRAWRVIGESGVVSRFEALRSGATPLVGRDEELELLRRRWQQAKTAEGAVEVVRQQTADLGGIARINDSGVRILHAARALRKVAVGK